MDDHIVSFLNLSFSYLFKQRIYFVLLKSLLPKTVDIVHKFDIEGVVVANHNDRFFALVDGLNAHYCVFNKVLCFEGALVVVDVIVVILFHTLEETLATRV